ncbi:MAG: helix-turn-helix transcriptional regulator [Clostridia bacterium]|nr:helix-turn-helix transcriptional regulator [Clostridia bacterium]
MLDQKIFGEKLRNHRKKLGMTQEEVAEKVGVSAQAISKWESGDCLPDCFNLKAISDVYKISADVLLETESSGDLDAVASKIEQLATEFVWSMANCDRYSSNLRKELGEDLWQMWKGIFFAEVGNRKLQEESKNQGNLRIIGSYGTKIWDDVGVACVIKSSLIKQLYAFDSNTTEVMQELCSEDGQKLILALGSDSPTPKQTLIEKADIELSRLNELLLLFTENRIIEFVADNRTEDRGYLICGHCGIVPYMVLSAMYILNKKNYTVSQFLIG